MRSFTSRRYLLVIPPMLIMIVFLIGGIFADVIAPGDPGQTNLLSRLEAPVFSGGTSEFPLGTDHVGRDIWTRIVHGARVSLIVVAIVVPGAALFGTAVGMFAGWRGGIVGQLLMRYVDVQLALPAILFAVLLGAVLGASLRNVIIILLVWTWTVYARSDPRGGALAEGAGVRRRFVGSRRQQLVDHAQAASAPTCSTRSSWS